MYEILKLTHPRSYTNIHNLVEKKDKDPKREDRIKLKRSYSPEDQRVEYREEWEERGSVTSNSSSHRSHHHSPEESPRNSDERG